MSTWKKKFKLFWDVAKKVSGPAFVLLSLYLTVLFPFLNIDKMGIKWSVLFVVGGFIVVVGSIAFISFFMTQRSIRSTSKEIYSSGCTKVVLEYGDIEDKIKSADNNSTIVVPVNTSLDEMFDEDKVGDGSILKTCLPYIKAKKNNLNKDFLQKLQQKKDKIPGAPIEIGDWYLISGKDIGRPESKISFLFLVMYDGELENGKIVNKYTKENFLVGLQSLFQEALHAPERYEKVYIPLIGAGNGEVGTKRQITSLLNALIQYNLDELKNRELEMHIIIREKNRKEVPIYLFSKIDSF